jgi:hypothetical protein
MRRVVEAAVAVRQGGGGARAGSCDTIAMPPSVEGEGCANAKRSPKR